MIPAANHPWRPNVARGHVVAAMKAAFDRHVDRVSGPFREHCLDLGRCWLWTGSLSEKGYGLFPFGKLLKAHRVSWELSTGKRIPAGLCVCHRCDTRSCVRPSHLFLGTNEDNIVDMMAKRAARGAS